MLKRKMMSLARRKLGIPHPLVSRQLGKQLFRVRDGTIRMHPDYDDAWLLACALQSRVIFDVGANIGQAAMMMLLSQDIEQLILIEANPDALAVAAENLIRNQISQRVRFICAFATDTDNDNIKFWSVGTGAAGSMYQGHAKSAAKSGTFTYVPAITIDTLCTMYGVVPDLIKIDVEGAEYQVLRGSTNCACGHRTRFLVEMHSPPELPMVENAASVIRWCEEHSYQAWYLSRATKLETAHQIASRGRCHLLLQPAEWNFPAWLHGIGQSASLDIVLSSALRSTDE